jgi:hypothetical protein
MTPQKRIQVTFDVATDSQAAELNAAWQEIVSGKRTRINTAAEDTNEIMERARTGLQRIVKAVEEHPGTGQARRLAEGDEPLVYARLLSDSEAKPLCGATDGPWTARGFDFQRMPVTSASPSCSIPKTFLLNLPIPPE